MRRIRVRITVFRMVLAVEVAAIVIFVATDRWKRITAGRSANYRAVAGGHAVLAKGFREEAEWNPASLRMARWHEFLSREFEQAAAHPWGPVPLSPLSPPAGWTPPIVEGSRPR
ncbi:hypothetical protein [Paludisphaera mucosa]|uniref:Uncharacterized protein n=1 Tax=Paludisphaera mucosa TaxID=3030827 RepID=A0ABT6FFR1_9BACT|nr:hypothetical protein [Paludisphaera mucosa]MDG3006326.1 hypothetical protein [Paludisphaera mucosa]